MKKIYVFEFTNKSPHIETALELAHNHAVKGDEVHFHFLGHDARHKEAVYPIHVSAEIYGNWLPERKGAKLVAHPNLHFYPRTHIPKKTRETYGFVSLEKLKTLKYKSFDLGMAVASSLISYMGDDRDDISPFVQRSDRMIDSAKEVYDFVLNLLEKEKLDLVYLFNGRFCHPKAVLRACEAASIPFLIHERGCNTGKYYLEPFMPHDRIKIQRRTLETWTQFPDRGEGEKIARKWFEKRRRGEDTDTKSYTREQSKNLLPNFDPGKKIITYYSSSNDEYSAVGDLFQWKGWQNQVDAVNHLIQIVDKMPSASLVVRLHPNLASKNANEKAPWYALKTRFPKVIFIEPESPVDSYALIERSDVIVTCGSKIGIETTFWQKPSILVGPCYYDELDVTYPAHSVEELTRLLNSDLKCKFSDNVLAYGLWWATFGIPHELYKSLSFNKGLFLGENLQEFPKIVKYSEAMYYGAKKMVFKLLKK